MPYASASDASASPHLDDSRRRPVSPTFCLQSSDSKHHQKEPPLCQSVGMMTTAPPGA